MAGKKAPEQWQNRIVGYGEEVPEDLLANALNFRIHPKAQQDALLDVINEVGFVDEVIVNRRTKNMVNGHLRVTLAMRTGQATIPVKYIDVSEAEERLILATFDPISALATTDAQKLDELLREVSTGSAAIQQMLDDMASSAGIVPGDWATAFNALPTGDKSPFQQMTFTVHDSQAEVVEQALVLAKKTGSFDGSPNENSNGNALTVICEAFLNG